VDGDFIHTLKLARLVDEIRKVDESIEALGLEQFPHEEFNILTKSTSTTIPNYQTFPKSRLERKDLLQARCAQKYSSGGQVTSPEEVKGLIIKYRKHLAEAQGEKKSRRVVKARIQDLTNRLTPSETRVPSVTECLSVEGFQTDLDGSNASVDEEVSLLENKEEECLQQHSLAIKYEQYLGFYSTYTKHLDTLNTLTAKISSLRKRHQRLLTIKLCAQKAELLSVEQLVAQINFKLEQHIDQFFSDDVGLPMVRLVLGKETTGKKGVRNILHIQVILRGCLYDDIKFLSKGEKRRVKLALMLTFADLLPTTPKLPPIYLLDESLSNLDGETQTNILGTLKTRTGLFLVVSHDAVKGVFDKVISW
jgi:energy-coupling factor transporter ATP-binding protein EcfA2